MKLRILGLLLITIAILPQKLHAWGMTGHRVVGEIASSYLNDKTRKEIRKIMGNESLAMSANWADFIKSDSAYDYLDTWHYINFERGLNLDQLKAVLKKDTAADAYTAIRFLSKELMKDEVSLEKKKFYLRLLVHFVGDIHQPLHVSPVGTSGGNDIKVNWMGAPSNLHRVWDSQLIDMQQLSYTEYTTAINYTTESQRKSWQSQPLSEWLFESYRIAEKLHDDIKQPEPRLGYRYNYDYLATVNQQLLKGGVRLAGLLNAIFSGRGSDLACLE